MQNIKQLKEKFPNIESATLLRFFRAAKNNKQTAVDKIVDHIKWRQDIFPISFESIKEECSKGKYLLCGRDKEGSLVIYIQGHELGPHTYTSIEHHMESVFYLLEVVCSEILEDPLEKFTIVYNRVKVEKKNRDFAWAENIGKTLANHYPERMKRAYVIPANIIFRTLWGIAKVFFDPDTASKIAFVSGPTGLKKYIDVEQLPVELGGNLEYKFDVDHLFTKKMPGVKIKMGQDRYALSSRCLQGPRPGALPPTNLNLTPPLPQPSPQSKNSGTVPPHKPSTTCLPTLRFNVY